MEIFGNNIEREVEPKRKKMKKKRDRAKSERDVRGKSKWLLEGQYVFFAKLNFYISLYFI